MTTNLVCSVATHSALKADLTAWLDIQLHGLQYIEPYGDEPAEVQAVKLCPACGSAIGRDPVPLTGELAEVWTILQREQAEPHGSVSLVAMCRKALDSDPLALQQFRSAMELERAMGGRP